MNLNNMAWSDPTSFFKRVDVCKACGGFGAIKKEEKNSINDNRMTDQRLGWQF